MDQPTAVILAGLGSAALAGGTAIITTYLNMRVSQAQQRLQLEESRKDREHDLKKQLLDKKREAIEIVWKLLFIAERSGGKLSDNDLQSFIGSLVWFPAGLRDNCLRAINTNAISRTEIGNIRHTLIEESKN